MQDNYVELEALMPSLQMVRLRKAGLLTLGKERELGPSFDLELSRLFSLMERNQINHRIPLPDDTGG